MTSKQLSRKNSIGWKWMSLSWLIIIVAITGLLSTCVYIGYEIGDSQSETEAMEKYGPSLKRDGYEQGYKDGFDKGYQAGVRAR